MGSDKRFTQHHVHMYMFFPYVISTLYLLIEETNENFQKIPVLCILLTTLHLREMNLFHRALLAVAAET
jgi:hypothetical protein